MSNTALECDADIGLCADLIDLRPSRALALLAEPNHGFFCGILQHVLVVLARVAIWRDGGVAVVALRDHGVGVAEHLPQHFIARVVVDGL